MERSRKIIGFAITGTYLVVVALYVLLKSDKFMELEPNAMGDFMAGSFAPLAFLWLVLGFFQQGDELRNSVEALRLQGDELRASVEQQKELVQVTRDQHAFELERARASEEERKRLNKPRILLADNGHQVNNGETIAMLALRNAGADCTSLQVHVEGRAIKTVPVFAKNEQTIVGIYMGSGPEGGSRKDIRITFDDVFGEPHSRSASIVFNGYKTILVLGDEDKD